MTEVFQKYFSGSSNIWNIILLILVISFIVYTMYLRIKYVCLKKAAEKVAEVEKMTNLTGEQKFAIVTLWIEEDLPKLFKSELVKQAVQKIVQLAYDNSSEYAKNYIKRKTGYDISGVLENLSTVVQSSSTDTKSDTSTDN